MEPLTNIFQIARFYSERVTNQVKVCPSIPSFRGKLRYTLIFHLNNRYIHLFTVEHSSGSSLLLVGKSKQMLYALSHF